MSQPQSEASNNRKKGSPLLIDEPPIVVLNGLKQLFGENEGTLIQQLNYWTFQPFEDVTLNVKMRVLHEDDLFWVRVPPILLTNRWTGRMRTSSESTLKRTITNCKSHGVVRSRDDLSNADERGVRWLALVHSVLDPQLGIYSEFFHEVIHERLTRMSNKRRLDMKWEEERYEEMNRRLSALRAAMICRGQIPIPEGKPKHIKETYELLGVQNDPHIVQVENYRSIWANMTPTVDQFEPSTGLNELCGLGNLTEHTLYKEFPEESSKNHQHQAPPKTDTKSNTEIRVDVAADKPILKQEEAATAAADKTATPNVWPHPVPESVSDAELLSLYEEFPSAIHKASLAHLGEKQPHLKPALKSGRGAALVKPFLITLMRANWPQMLHDLTARHAALKVGNSVEVLAPLVALDFEQAELALKWWPYLLRQKWDSPPNWTKIQKSLMLHPEKWSEPNELTNERQASEGALLKQAENERASQLAAQQQAQEKAQSEKAQEVWPQLTDQQKATVFKVMERDRRRGQRISDIVQKSGGIECIKPTETHYQEFFICAGAVLDIALREAAVAASTEKNREHDQQQAEKQNHERLANLQAALGGIVNRKTMPNGEISHSEQPVEQPVEQTEENPLASPVQTSVETPAEHKRAVASIVGYVLSGTYAEEDLDDHVFELCEKFNLDESGWQSVRAEVLSQLQRGNRKAA
jgi:hypothetical protein